MQLCVFFSVAARVLKQDKLELDGYLLQLNEKQPELFLPLDRKKLYVENLNPNTTKDSLWNYMEVRTKLDVSEIQFGDNGNAFITFNEEPGRIVNDKFHHIWRSMYGLHLG